MGYRSDVTMVLWKPHFDELIKGLSAKEEWKYLADIFKRNAKEGTTPDETYVMTSVDCFKWYSEYDEIDFVERFLNKHRHSFIRIGETVEDIEIDNKSWDEWGSDEEFEWMLDVKVVADCDWFDDDNNDYEDDEN